MKILISGGAGFVGSSIARYLATTYPHFQITVIDNFKRRGSYFNIELLEQLNVNVIHGDVRILSDLLQVDNCDILIECSAEPSALSGNNSSPNYVVDANLIGLINCLEYCRLKKSGIIFFSSSRVYPFNPLNSVSFLEDDTRYSLSLSQTIKGVSTQGISENFEMEGTRSLYGATKLCGELLINEFADLYEIPSLITRFGVIAGPGQFGKVDQGFFALWIINHMLKKDLSYIGYEGSGKQVRDILAVSDVCLLLDKQIQNLASYRGDIFNAGGGVENSISLLELTTLCSNITDNKLDISVNLEDRYADVKLYITDNAKVSNEFKWHPSISVENLAEDVFNWAQENPNQIRRIFG